MALQLLLNPLNSALFLTQAKGREHEVSEAEVVIALIDSAKTLVVYITQTALPHGIAKLGSINHGERGRITSVIMVSCDQKLQSSSLALHLAKGLS